MIYSSGLPMTLGCAALIEQFARYCRLGVERRPRKKPVAGKMPNAKHKLMCRSRRGKLDLGDFEFRARHTKDSTAASWRTKCKRIFQVSATGHARARKVQFGEKSQARYKGGFQSRLLPIEPRKLRQFIAGIRSPRIGPAPPLSALEPTTPSTPRMHRTSTCRLILRRMGRRRGSDPA